MKTTSESPDRTREAIKTSLNILGYKNNTEKQLRMKLAQREFTKNETDSAVEYLKSKGYLDETRMIESEIRFLANSKLYGKQRIFMELKMKGFPSGLISEVDFDDEKFDDIDFDANCRKLFLKRGGTPDDKTLAFLRRYGYSGPEIRRAVSQSEE